VQVRKIPTRKKNQFVFDPAQVQGMGRIDATDWEMASFFGCSTKTIERARKRDSSGFDTAYKEGKRESNLALRTKILELALKGNTFLLWKLALNRLGFFDTPGQVINISQSAERTVVPVRVDDPVKLKLLNVVQVIRRESEMEARSRQSGEPPQPERTNGNEQTNDC
jgi:hypothetical protein